MRRTLSVTAAIAVAVIFALVVPTSAQAAWRDPVNPYPDLPSAQYKTWVQGSSGPVTIGYEPGSTVWQEEMAARKQYLADRGYAPPSTPSRAGNLAAAQGRVPDISSLPKTLTPPTLLSRAATGASVLGAFQAGWTITDGVLAIYGTVTNTDPLAGACDSDDWIQDATQALYMFSAPDCTLPVTQPNSDQKVTWGGEFQGYRFDGYRQHCVKSCDPAGINIRFWDIIVTPLEGVQPKKPYGIAADGKTYSTSGAGYPEKFPAPGYALCFSVDSTGRPCKPGGTFQPTQTVGNPLRTAECTLGYPGGGTVTGTGGQYRESDGIPPAVLGAACNAASLLARDQGRGLPTSISLGTRDEANKRETLSEQTVPSFTPEEEAALNDTTGKGLVLWKGGSSCLAWAADCAGWWEETQRGTSTATDYRCTFGDAQVSLAQCYVYERTFEPVTDPLNDNPVITDPVTGEPTPWTGNEGMNSTDPGTGPMPGDNCMDSWGAAPNPIEWVMHPVKCAMVWAFVARDAKVTEAQEKIDSSWRGSTPGQLSAAVLAISPAVLQLADGGCGGIVLAYPAPAPGGGFHLQNAAMLPACPGDFFAPWAPVFKFFIGVALAVAGVAAIKRLLDSFVGMS